MPDMPEIVDDSSDEGGESNAEDDEKCNSGLLKKVSDLDEEEESENGPDWMFEEGETSSKDPEYVFCPAPHRKQLLCLFTKHFCQHPLFKERLDTTTWSKEKIRHNAVYKMYKFCHTRGLREVWGYMWASWYSPKMWKLWAHSTSPYVSRLRTTMTVENHWRQLKHNYLSNGRSCADYVIWILLNKVTPSFLAHANILDNTFRLGRPKAFSTYQEYFKKNWMKHEKKKILPTSSQYIIHAEIRSSIAIIYASISYRQLNTHL